jgi:hypothetical protein
MLAFLSNIFYYNILSVQILIRNTLSGNASCKFNGCQAKYTFIISEKPTNEKAAFIPIKIMRKEAHRHEIKKGDKPLQLRGEEREEAAKDAILNFNGSATSYVNSLAAKGVVNLPSEQVSSGC